MKKFIFYILLISIASCGKDPDPCNGVTETKAKFASYNVPQLIPKFLLPYWVHTDYTLQAQGMTVKVDSTIQWDSLEWHFGNEIIYNETSVYRFDIPPGKFTISLIVTKKPNKQCFPNDDGKDTMTRTYQIASSNDDNRIIGKYRGAFVNFPAYPDTFEFTLFFSRNGNGPMVIDTFPFTYCKEIIRNNGASLNEILLTNDYGIDCNRDPIYVIRYLYIRNIDNNSNQVEIIANPTGTLDYNNNILPKKIIFRGYRL